MESDEKSIGEAPDPLGDAINRIMANPELIATVAAALGKTPPTAPPAPPPKKEEASPSSEHEAIATLLPILSGLTGSSAPPENDSARLLHALKPFVSQGRRDAIDTLLRFSRITPILKQLNSSKKGDAHVRTSTVSSSSDPQKL